MTCIYKHFFLSTVLDNIDINTHLEQKTVVLQTKGNIINARATCHRCLRR